MVKLSKLEEAIAAASGLGSSLALVTSAVQAGEIKGEVGGKAHHYWQAQCHYWHGTTRDVPVLAEHIDLRVENPRPYVPATARPEDSKLFRICPDSGLAIWADTPEGRAAKERAIKDTAEAGYSASAESDRFKCGKALVVGVKANGTFVCHLHYITMRDDAPLKAAWKHARKGVRRGGKFAVFHRQGYKLHIQKVKSGPRKGMYLNSTLTASDQIEGCRGFKGLRAVNASTNMVIEPGDMLAWFKLALKAKKQDDLSPERLVEALQDFYPPLGVTKTEQKAAWANAQARAEGLFQDRITAAEGVRSPRLVMNESGNMVPVAVVQSDDPIARANALASVRTSLRAGPTHDVGLPLTEKEQEALGLRFTVIDLSDPLDRAGTPVHGIQRIKVKEEWQVLGTCRVWPPRIAALNLFKAFPGANRIAWSDTEGSHVVRKSEYLESQDSDDSDLDNIRDGLSRQRADESDEDYQERLDHHVTNVTEHFPTLWQPRVMLTGILPTRRSGSYGLLKS